MVQRHVVANKLEAGLILRQGKSDGKTVRFPNWYFEEWNERVTP
jgi:hypothetical protein